MLSRRNKTGGKNDIIVTPSTEDSSMVNVLSTAGSMILADSQSRAHYLQREAALPGDTLLISVNL